MNIFGYAKNFEDDLLEMTEVTIKADAKEISEIIKFLERCKQEVERDCEWEHEHIEVDGLLFGVYSSES